MTPSFFTSFSYFYHCCLFLYSSFKNFEHDLPQLERPKGGEVHNSTWHPKVAQTNNDIWHSKVAKSNNTIAHFLSLQFSCCQSFKTQ